MCDTLMLSRPGETWFAKNSDREPDEPQRIEWHEAAVSRRGMRQATYIAVDAPAHRHATWLSRPDWMWGAEMGLNEHGVAIGNQAVFTRLLNRRECCLLGMDLLRLALEQGSSADEALAVITGYLERYGQGGPAGFRNKRFRYDNSFLIADARGGWQLETAGRYWVAKKITAASDPCYAAISNCLSIHKDYDLSSPAIEENSRRAGHWNGRGDFDFAAVFSTRLMPWLGRARSRRACTLGSLGQMNGARPLAAQFATILRKHHREAGPGSNADICMHAAGPLRPSQTTQSMIARLDPASARVWMTGGAAPCISLYKPLAQPGTGDSPDWLLQRTGFWEAWQAVHRRARKDRGYRERLQRRNADCEQALWQAGPEQSREILESWWQAVQEDGQPGAGR